MSIPLKMLLSEKSIPALVYLSFKDIKFYLLFKNNNKLTYATQVVALHMLIQRSNLCCILCCNKETKYKFLIVLY